MAAREATVAGLGRTVERFVQGPRAVPVLFGTALVVYGAISVALPLAAGRDLARYLQAYAQLVGGHVVFPNVVLTRTPGTPLVTGVLLEAGSVASEVCVAVLYALSILAWFSVARRFGAFAAGATAVALLAYPGYVLLFHELASDALFAACFALVALLLVQAFEAADGGPRGGARGRRRDPRLRPSGRPGARRARARAAPRGARSAPAPGRGGSLRGRRARAARRARRPQRCPRRRLHRRPRRLGLPPLQDVRRRPHRPTGQRDGVRGARPRRRARASPERAVPVARHRPRHLLFVREPPDAGRPHRALRQDLGLG